MDGRVEFVEHVVDPFAHDVVDDRGQRGLQRETDAEEALDDRVVEVAGESLALFGERQLAHVGAQHLLVDHEARGPTEGLGELLVFFAEGSPSSGSVR